MLHRCSYCDKGFSYNHTLQEHIKVKHGGLRYRCDLCIKAYTCKETKRDHMKDVHGIDGVYMARKFSCPECGKMYCREGQLNEHRKAEHFGAIFPCPFCGKKYKYNWTLVKHVNRKHQQQNFDYEKILKEGKDNWKYAVENNVPLDVLPDNIRNAVGHYLWYIATNNSIYGDSYYKV